MSIWREQVERFVAPLPEDRSRSKRQRSGPPAWVGRNGDPKTQVQRANLGHPPCSHPISQVFARSLEAGEGGELGGGDGFLLEEDLEALAHAFGVDEGFELQARADAVGFIHAVIVEVGELISLP